MKPDVIAVGEMLVDFVSTSPLTYKQTPAFEICFGAAPMNTLVGVSGLHVSAGAMTAAEDDPIGQFLVDEPKEME